MMAMDDLSPVLTHVTLDTADVRISPRTEVLPETLASLGEMLADALRWGGARVPGRTDPRVMVRATEGDGVLLLTVHGREMAPLATIGIAQPGAVDAVSLWRMLHETAGRHLATDPASPPLAPWCAVRLEVGLLLDPPAAEWLGDLERSIAWTWLVGS